MITSFTVLFGLSALAIIVCLYATRKLKKNYAFSLRMTLISSLVITAVHIAILNSHNYKFVYFCYSVFFIFIDILLLSIFDFSRKYTKYRVRLPWFNWVLVGGGILDCSSSFLSNLFEHSFGLKTVTVPAFLCDQATDIFKIIMKWPYYIHLGACYFVILLLIISISIRIATTPQFYRFMHTNILTAILVTVAGDSFYVFTNSPVDFSIIFSAASSVMLCIYAIHVTPGRLIQKQLKTVVSNMIDSVAVFDIDDELVYENKAMTDLIIKYQSIGLNPRGPFKSLLSKESYKKLKTMPDRDFDEDVTKDERTYTFHISIRSIRDKNNTFLGAFFIIHDKTSEMDKLNQERYLSIHDKLTNLYNQDGFFEKARSMLMNNADEPYLMICTDIDNFKIINDLFGRDTGDELLVRVSNALRTYAKKTDVSARLGSDRFALLMRKADYDEKVFEHYPDQVAYISDDLMYPVNFHIGVYEIEDVTTPVSVMCDRAFMAINTIKGDLQTKIAYYNSNLRKNIVREQQLVGEFAAAMASEQFQMYLQPQVTVEGNIFGAEALVRWRHPKEGILRPDEFIPLFEQKGLITTLDKFIWDEAAHKLSEWKKQGFDNMYISVNISPRDFVYIDIYKTFTDLVNHYDIDPKNLKLEITESGILMNFEKTLELIKKLREFGFLVEMDDFGSGYSSLNLLKDIPFDILKIDMAFLEATDNQERSIQILHSIINMSKRLNMPVITEGVETKEQVEFLKDMGTDYYQGFYFARPMPVSEFESNYIKQL